MTRHLSLVSTSRSAPGVGDPHPPTATAAVIPPGCADAGASTPGTEELPAVSAPAPSHRLRGVIVHEDTLAVWCSCDRLVTPAGTAAEAAAAFAAHLDSDPAS